jgi:3-oxoacyl-[acyl-carrier-protein] synthase-3
VNGVFAYQIEYALGDRKLHVSDSAAEGLLTSDPADLESAGFRWHYVCQPTTSALDLAEAAVRAVDKHGGLQSPDAIIYATCLPLNGNAGDTAQWRRTRDVKHLMDFPASRLQARFGLPGAVVLGINQQACTSMLGALRVARALLATEPGWHRILCVTADRFPPGSVYEQAYNPISDGAVACLVGTEPAGLELVACHQITCGGLAGATDDETVGSYFAYTHRLITQITERAGLAVTDLDWIVPQNTHEKTWQILSRVLGVPEDRVWYPSLPEVGHVISGDAMINLRELADSGRLRPGDKILAVMAGFGLNWQAAIFQATDGLGAPADGREVR